jgi:4'-phosphopantetheinyl transferase EntD
MPLPAGVLGAIALPEEQAWVARLLAVRPDTHWDRLLFSAKESVYKAWFPMTQSMARFPASEDQRRLVELYIPCVDRCTLVPFNHRFLG